SVGERNSQRRIEDAILQLGGPPAAPLTKLRRLFPAKQRSPIRAQRDPAWAGDRLRLAVAKPREQSAPGWPARAQALPWRPSPVRTRRVFRSAAQGSPIRDTPASFPLELEEGI